MNATSSSTAPRGTKRKRPDTPAEDPTTKLAGKLACRPVHHELKEVRKAAKKARTFETQRVVKKLKGLRKKNPEAPDVGVLEAELEELKTIDADTIGATALRTRLLKDRHISESVPACAAIARELPPGSSVPSATDSKVHARLLSARALGAAVAQTVASLRAVLLPPPDAGAGVGAGGDAEVDEDENENEENEPDSDREAEANGDAEDADEAGWESGSVDAGGDEEGDDDGWESGSVHSDAAPPPKKAAATTKSVTKSATTKPTPAPIKTSTTSQFLPSLAVGYVRGGSSDSDIEDVEEAGGEKKNRRGQRARRAIWEKKYGRGANHKKKEAEEAAQERATQKAQFEARQAKREAAQASGKGRGKWNESAQVADAGWGARAPARTGAVATPAPAAAMHARPAPVRAKPDKDAGIHPSWAAKKALKEKMGVGIVPSQGKKIVFS
ncbi:Bud-site selection protein [Mycena albidolilacea]|uniref:Bud-site selection protein n=1 Tax=Mycena albidolilacea TaxID=1033008 RepID=A0AAD7F4V6_9AGAR|nr:Bud-site selection protein [Mycena albidolilacea]